MLLAIDIGNSNLVFGLYQDGKWIQTWRIMTETSKDEEHYHRALSDEINRKLPSGFKIQKCVLSSVVPILTPILSKAIQRISGFEPLIIGPDLYHKLPVKINNPEEIGTDLVANAVAAQAIYGKDCIIVDFGTALTLTTMRADGTLLGVSIAPGIHTAIKALSSNAAQLPEVPLIMPQSVLGKNTIHAIQSGILIGYTGLVKELIRATRKEVGGHFGVVATGGMSSILSTLECEFDLMEPNLTLEGLRLISEIMR